ncbi:hypothetical protein DYBT9623_00912 [Dyadobacter sp. CECT 9623]|uniref:DUF2851 domain-containing protein n=1 Tax=Dyadobacter linearis TaxID=2823330 RepID=A0ABM8UL59_9BACT|nr:DUF2851 family protein [Dyadobacter sp. CECT 9623]CAG5068183.1 hypothetical protein DYBT9623_00912 [Dyadobacter sp. CECT 9623]
MMNEEILSFVWRFQYFESANLATDDQKRISVIRTGHRNNNAGPDFLEAAVVIDDVHWYGSIEIHVRSSDWFVHTHDSDPAYESVILHLVWENDKPVMRQDGTLVPTLALKGLVKNSIMERYALLQDMGDTIPCSGMFSEIHEIHKYAMLDRVLLERLDRKAAAVMEMLEKNRNDWEETAYQWLGMHFGFKLNDPAFLRLTQIVPLKIIQKHRDRLLHIEAILFGCAGLIPEKSEDIYVRSLQKEFRFFSTKYKLADKVMQSHEWKFAKLRPAGFPTIRLAQLARLLSIQGNLFSTIISVNSFEKMQELFQLRQSEYWVRHYVFDKKAATPVPFMGKDAGSLLIINGIIPVLVAFARQRQQPELLDKAIDWLSQLPSENNRITREWATLGMRVKTSADSQALIEWYNNYCLPKKCLDCTVGAGLVRSN